MDADLKEALKDIRNDLKVLSPLKELVEMHHKALYGNGHNGIIKDVERLDIETRTHFKRDNYLIGVAGTLFAAIFGEAAKKYFGL